MTTNAVERTYGTPESNVAAEDITPKEIVTDTVGVGVERADGTEEFWDGIALAHPSQEWAHENDEDESALVYSAADDDRVPYGGYTDGSVIRPLTIEETTSGTTAAPSLSEGDVVGVPDTTNTDAPSSPGRVVEEGYSNNEDGDTSTTTFSRANGNFLPIGRVANVGDETVTGYGVEVRVEVDKSL